jgi:ABC-type glycerol-3-phosphate transport system substrate-binding protein
MKIVKSYAKRFLCVYLTCLFLTSGLLDYSTARGEALSDTTASLVTDIQAENYYTYFSQHQNDLKTKKSVDITAPGFSKSENLSHTLMNIDGKDSIIIDNENNWCDWKINIEETGLYNILLDYYPIKGSGQNIELSVYIDGILPFTEAQTVSLPRIWADKKDGKGVAIHQDVSGNDIKPEQIEQPRWSSIWLTDKIGLYEDPYWFYLEKGSHTIRLGRLRENVAIKGISLAVRPSPKSYKDYIAGCAGFTQVKNQLYKIEAENSCEKNSAMLAPTYDTSNAGMTPLDPNHIKLNSIGRDSWNQNGQSISWKVPDDIQEGMYILEFRTKQSKNPGIPSYRTLYINGEIPFAEAKSISFPYKSDWYIKTLRDGNPQLVHLKKGDTLTLQATTGDTQNILRYVNQTVLDLNALYRQIIIITGVNPDIYRDYSIEKEIPNLIDDFKKYCDSVAEISKMVKQLLGKPSSQTAVLDQLVLMIDGFIDNPNLIPENINGFKSSIDGMASLIYSFSEQPLELDKIYIRSANTANPKANPDFFSSLGYGMTKFMVSFFGNYSSLSKFEENSKAITVWVNTGRDQAQIINRQIVDSFTPKSGIVVNLNLVSGESTLIQAVMAGKGPDVSMTMPMETPINLALRGAAVNLADKSFHLSDSFKNEFFNSAWTPFTYKGGIYAIPEMQFFPVLFYRSDILKQLGITVPQTWDQFYHDIKLLQSKNLQIGILEADSLTPGISASIPIFDSFLFQNGGTYFNQALTKTAFETSVAYGAFDKWVELYREYGLDRSFDFANRFRTGEMPMGITYFNMYNTIATIAPEMSGLWSFAQIPGTMKSDGTIDRSTSSMVFGSVMLRQAKERHVDQEAFQFMTWWTGDEAQTTFAQGVESVMGVASRYPAANKSVFEKIAWTATESDNLMKQWQWVKSIPQVPGSYILNRSLTNAFRQSVDNREEARRMLSVYNQDINDEMARKSREFEKNQFKNAN